MSGDHCPGCACDILSRDVVLIPVAGVLLHEMTQEWSPPVQVKIERDPSSPGGWAMTCRTVPTWGARCLDER